MGRFSIQEGVFPAFLRVVYYTITIVKDIQKYPKIAVFGFSEPQKLEKFEGTYGNYRYVVHFTQRYKTIIK